VPGCRFSLNILDIASLLSGDKEFAKLKNEVDYFNSGLKSSYAKDSELSRSELGLFHKASELSLKENRNSVEEVVGILSNSAIRLMSFIDAVLKLNPSIVLEHPKDSTLDYSFEKFIDNIGADYYLTHKTGWSLHVSVRNHDSNYKKVVIQIKDGHDQASSEDHGFHRAKDESISLDIDLVDNNDLDYNLKSIASHTIEKIFDGSKLVGLEEFFKQKDQAETDWDTSGLAETFFKKVFDRIQSASGLATKEKV
jgi:hypothetical protein